MVVFTDMKLIPKTKKDLQSENKQLKELAWSNMLWSMFLTICLLGDLAIITTILLNIEFFYNIGWGWVFVGLGTFTWLFLNKKLLNKWQKILKTIRTKIPRKKDIQAEEEVKRIGFIKRIWFKIRAYQMKNAMLKKSRQKFRMKASMNARKKY